MTITVSSWSIARRKMAWKKSGLYRILTVSSYVDLAMLLICTGINKNLYFNSIIFLSIIFLILIIGTVILELQIAKKNPDNFEIERENAMQTFMLRTLYQSLTKKQIKIIVLVIFLVLAVFISVALIYGLKSK